MAMPKKSQAQVQSKVESPVVELSRFNMNITGTDLRAFKRAAKAQERTMAAWARQVLRKAAGL